MTVSVKNKSYCFEQKLETACACSARIAANAIATKARASVQKAAVRSKLSRDK